MCTKHEPEFFKCLSKQVIMLVPVVALALLAACSVSPPNIPTPAYKQVHPAQQFTLTQPVTIPPDKAAVYLQNGRVVDFKLVNLRVPNCRLVVNGLSEQERIVQPDSFTLIRLHYDSTFVMNGNIKVATLLLTPSMLTQVGMSNDIAPIAEEYTTSFYFKPKPDSIVSHLICAHWEDPHDGHHLSLQQIRQALGSIIEIKT